jgi:hypothetical protein
LVAVSGFVGCGEGGEPASLSGTITYNGDPIPNGTIRLDPAEGTPGGPGASKITDGKYSIPLGDSLKAGKHNVTFGAQRPTGGKVEGEVIEAGEGDEDILTGDAGDTREMEEYLPAKYTGGSVTIELKPGENTKNWDLEP